MAESYERERQNNSRLDELAAKVSALRGVTIDIYDNARNQDVLDNTVRLRLSPSLLPPIFPCTLPLLSSFPQFLIGHELTHIPERNLLHNGWQPQEQRRTNDAHGTAG